MNAHRSIWLLLSQQDEHWAQSLIDRLAEELGTPRFQPHLTLLGDVALPEQTLTAQLQTATAASATIQTRISGIEYLDEFFRTFFLRIEDHPAIRALHEQIHTGFGRHPEPRFMPHISLIYGELKPALKKNLYARLEDVVAHRTVCFNRVALVHAAKGLAIENWTLLETFALGNTKATNA